MGTWGNPHLAPMWGAPQAPLPPFPQILAMVERYQGIARVKERSRAFTEKARGIINEFPDSPYSARVV